MKQAQTPADVQMVLAAMTDELDELDVPANWQPRHEALMAESESLTLQVTSLLDRAPPRQAPRAGDRARMEAHCIRMSGGLTAKRRLGAA